jgi:hypothetical protein
MCLLRTRKCSSTRICVACFKDFTVLEQWVSKQLKVAHRAFNTLPNQYNLKLVSQSLLSYSTAPLFHMKKAQNNSIVLRLMLLLQGTVSCTLCAEPAGTAKRHT